MGNILEEIADYAKLRVKKDEEKCSLSNMRDKALKIPGDDSFYKKFKTNADRGVMSYICEIKKASPSKGIIAEHFPYMDIAREYDLNGADAISCLTEPKYFLGSDDYLKNIVSEVKIPVLRKDFVVSEYQIYQARVLGASAILLICAILDDVKLKAYLELAGSLGMSALVECHDEEEIERALKVGARIIGVNNRNLKNFSVDLDNAVRLRKMIPENRIYVAESGVASIEDAKRLRDYGADVLLIGEMLMRSPDRAATLKELRDNENKG